MSRFVWSRTWSIYNTISVPIPTVSQRALTALYLFYSVVYFHGLCFSPLLLQETFWVTRLLPRTLCHLEFTAGN